MEKTRHLNQNSLLTVFVAVVASACNQQTAEAAHLDKPGVAPAALDHASALQGSERVPATAHHHPEPAASPGPAAPKSFDAKPQIGTRATCPVTGGAFEVSENTPVSEHKGKYYAFCCAGCKPKFDADPDKYL